MLIFELFFFIGFGLFSLACIAIGFFWIEKFDGSTGYSLPKVKYFNAFEIVALRSGRNGIIETALVNLWHRKLLKTTGKGRTAQVKQLELSHQVF
ncbi:hypothetical protein BGP_3919 [Beggiatoa sp. PS]|nr:hypothetical protein BGP_3919 [Beggiatoa sp. PS]